MVAWLAVMKVVEWVDKMVGAMDMSMVFLMVGLWDSMLVLSLDMTMEQLMGNAKETWMGY